MREKRLAKFLRVRCTDCGNEQFVFSHASMPIRCQVCSKTLAVPRGGKAEVKVIILGATE